MRYVLSLVALSLLALPSPVKREKNKHVARFGGLVISVTAIEDTEGKSGFYDRHNVVVYVNVKNTGGKPACASFSAKIKTTFGLEYTATYGAFGQRRFPDHPRIHEMLPGEESSGAYIFNVKDGVKPLEMTLKLQGKSVQCRSSNDIGWGDILVPEEARFDVGMVCSPKTGPVEM